MNIVESYRTCVIKKYADFKGVASRSEYWWFWLIYIFILLGLPLIAFLLEDVMGIKFNDVSSIALMLAWGLGSLGLLCPFIAVSIRRLRDAGYSGWLFLIRFIPYIGTIATWILMMKKTK